MTATMSGNPAERVKYAMSVSAVERHLSVLPPAEEYLELGYNYRMTDMQAAVGIVRARGQPLFGLAFAVLA